MFRRWGHAGMEIGCADGASDYFAFWPVEAPDLSIPVLGRLVTSLQFDRCEGQLGGQPDREIALDAGVCEHEVRLYWQTVARHPPMYFYRDFNCCEAVVRAVRAGLPRDRGALPAYTPLTFLLAQPTAVTFSTPHSVEAWLDLVNRWLRASSAEPRPAREPRVPEPSWGGA
jgi:hypothetical protein